MKRLVPVLAALVVAAPVPAARAACAPIGEAEAVAAATAVFAGVAIRQTAPVAPATIRSTTFAIDRVAKGSLGPRAVVLTDDAIGESSSFTVGRRYFVYATASPDGLGSSVCGGTVEATRRSQPGWSPTVPIYLVRRARLVPVHRPRRAGEGILAAAIRQLLTGPTRAQIDAGLRSRIPAGTPLRRFRVSSSGAVTVRLGQPFPPVNLARERLAAAQIVTTLVANGARSVTVTAATGPLATVAGPMDIRDFAALSGVRPPAILLKRAAAGDTSVAVSGTANTFEANVQLRVRQGDTIVATTFTTARCGTGCRGSFTARIGIPAAISGPAIVEAYTLDAKTGGIADLVGLPITVP